MSWLRKLLGRRVELPESMLAEIARLGESRAQFQEIADFDGIKGAQGFLDYVIASSRLFEKWFPRLTQFASMKRRAIPLPADDAFTECQLSVRRILGPKIVKAERVPQRNTFTAAIFTAPLAALPLVTADWPSSYRNAVFLTPEESREWHGQYDEPDDAPWWCVFQYWNVEPDFPADSFSLLHSHAPVPPGTTPLLVTSGLMWGSLAGGEDRELWAIGPSGESFVCELEQVTF